MNNEKFARENKRIIKGMGIGAIAGPLVFLGIMYVKNHGPLQAWQIIASIAIGFAFGLIIGGIISANLAVSKTVDSKIPWQKKVLKLAPQVIGTGVVVAAASVVITLVTNWGSVDIVKTIFSTDTLWQFFDGVLLGLITIR
ncbi:hypothetical protein AYP97_04360 [Lactobacillus crispatus]|uniref:hypothetical protein n=1 Tax=Lactobacillus TaxID=1578 RepID=UPI000B5DA645|nr:MULTISPECIES: hypothetical protein [Lactobacillus]OXC27146.1 hypothetical protein AYP85_01190 [Lactobacillus crispatus]OXC44866.1 hypothetical protein AYP95_07130 [Lactobacillus crispatus]OXC44970.1 hypothetical protein AYP94_00500 [Lactobacillus crispatus]OXC49047.1 hypothetical protein AYP96_04980 [Lactobacillus crispatus]OXC50354.1 hypothetical protein AYP97_04360 [Lactobacillus crispatus]